MNGHTGSPAQEPTTAQPDHMAEIEELCNSEGSNLDPQTVEMRAVAWERQANGSLRGRALLEPNSSIEFELLDDEASSCLRVIEGGNDIRLLALHFTGTSVEFGTELLIWKRDRRELLPEAEYAAVYALAAADYQRVFLKGESP